MIGKGAFGQVYEATIPPHSLPKYAVKVVDRLSLPSPEYLKRVKNEIAIHRDLRHPNILRLYHSFEDYKAVYLVMELCQGGELYQLIKREGRVLEKSARQYTEHVVNGLVYLHERVGIMHRDLKLSNILLYLDGENQRTIAKIGDFGLACHYHRQDKEEAVELGGVRDGLLNMTICGTPNYLAPEVVMKRPYGREADIWSLGCLVYAMLVGKAPFEGRSLRDTFDKVIEGKFVVPEGLSMAAKDLICSLMQSDPAKRIRLGDILKHPFVTGCPLISLPLGSDGDDDDLIKTSRLRPIKQPIKHGFIEITSSGKVIFTVDADRSVMTVSGDGQRVSFTDANQRTESCTFSELGRAARKRYDYMKRFVDLVRSKTPLIVIRTSTFRMTLFDRDRVKGVVVTMQAATASSDHPVLFVYCERDDTVTMSGGSGGGQQQQQTLFHPTCDSIQQIEDPTSRRWLLEFVNRVEQMKRVFASLPGDYLFPFVIDEATPSSRPSPPSYITLKSFEGGGSASSLTAISALQQHQHQQIRTRVYCQGVGWRVSTGLDRDLYLLNDGRQFVHDALLGRYSEDDGVTWQGLTDRVLSVVRAFPHR
jgi:serine/threonine protein kinase